MPCSPRLVVPACTLIMAALLILTADAATWRVERDGSGDFTVIHEAVAAAATGDIIEIGPGRYTDFTTPYGYPVLVDVNKDLTLIGAGKDETIIGPADPLEFSGHEYVIGILLRGDGRRIALRDLAVENILWRGIVLERGRLEIDRCAVRRCDGLALAGNYEDGGWIRDCRFHDIGGDGPSVATSFHGWSDVVDISGCRYTACRGVAIAGYGLLDSDMVIHDCVFEDVAIGVAFHDHGSGSVRHCTFSGMTQYGLWLVNAGNVIIEDNLVSGGGDGDSAALVIQYPVVDVTIRGNVFAHSNCVVRIPAPVGTPSIHENRFLRTSATAWWVDTAGSPPIGEPVVIDMENNGWGTTDTDLIDLWIRDGNDSEDVDLYVDYLPLAGGTIRTESASWAKVKRLFSN